VVKIGQTENNLPANELLVLLAHTSGLHTACMHRRYALSIPILSVGDFKERIGDLASMEVTVFRDSRTFYPNFERLNHTKEILW
jgi:hypothetical protein